MGGRIKWCWLVEFGLSRGRLQGLEEQVVEGRDSWQGAGWLFGGKVALVLRQAQVEREAAGVS